MARKTIINAYRLLCAHFSALGFGPGTFDYTSECMQVESRGFFFFRTFSHFLEQNLVLHVTAALNDFLSIYIQCKYLTCLCMTFIYFVIYSNTYL